MIQTFEVIFTKEMHDGSQWICLLILLFSCFQKWMTAIILWCMLFICLCVRGGEGAIIFHHGRKSLQSRNALPICYRL